MLITHHSCNHCKSINIRKNKKTKIGKQKYHCLDCGRYGTLELTPKYSDERKKEIIDAYFERPSMRGISRIFKVSRQTLSRWLVKHSEEESFKTIDSSIEDVPDNDTLELDEVYSFVQKKE
ncbi:IS1/IS1595 family N-terminal zinc-binding domain-containing protein [Rhodoflexus sp.]